MGSLLRRRSTPTRLRVELDEPLVVAALTPHDDYFVRPDWPSLFAWVATLPESQRDPACWQLAERWLQALQVDLTEYHLHVGRHLLLLSPRGPKKRRQLGDFGDEVLTTLKDELADLLVPYRGPHVVLHLEDNQDYLEYVSYWGPPGKPMGQSSGMCIRSDYLHVVLRGEQSWQLQATLAHELTHDCLSGRDLPAWLEEGLAQLMEGRFALYGHQLVNRDSARRHREFWKKRGLSSFWSGASFHQPGDIQELSYELALFLTRRLLEDHRGRPFDGFLEHAHHDDAGAQAAQEHLGCVLQKVVADFLGPGEWAPV